MLVRSTPGLASWLMNSAAVPRVCERGTDVRIEGVTQTATAPLGGDHA